MGSRARSSASVTQSTTSPPMSMKAMGRQFASSPIDSHIREGTNPKTAFKDQETKRAWPPPLDPRRQCTNIQAKLVVGGRSVGYLRVESAELTIVAGSVRSKILE